MLKKVRNYFFEEEAVASPSDKAVMSLVAMSLGLAAFAVLTSIGGM